MLFLKSLEDRGKSFDGFIKKLSDLGFDIFEMALGDLGQGFHCLWKGFGIFRKGLNYFGKHFDDVDKSLGF